MVKVSNKTIGLLGGTFDPAHNGHLIISKTAIKKFKLSKVLWIVTKNYAGHLAVIGATLTCVGAGIIFLA